LATYALISDVHGNIDALRAVVESIESGPGVDEIVCLGDVIGYCPASNEVIELLGSLEARYPVRHNLGSHDGAALGEYQFVDISNAEDSERLLAAGVEDEEQLVAQYFNPEVRQFVPVRAEARDAMQWTLERLTPESLEFMRSRMEPRVEIEPGVISVHGSPRDPACEYVRDAKVARKCFESDTMQGVWLCFVGHTHLPVVWKMASVDVVEVAGSRVCVSPPRPDFSERVELFHTSTRYIINVGSVGQPRDRNAKACYGRFSSGEGVFEHVRVAYDIEAAAARIREAGLAERLAERLHKGE